MFAFADDGGGDFAGESFVPVNFLIPSYNPGPKVRDTVAAARARWNPVWVVRQLSTNLKLFIPNLYPRFTILKESAIVINKREDGFVFVRGTMEGYPNW